MNVTNQFQQTSIPFAKNRSVTALKQMTHELVLAVEVQRVALLQALHNFGERVLPDFHQKVNMIGHQDVSTELKLVAHPVVVQQLQVTAPIGIATKDRLALVAT